MGDRLKPASQDRACVDFVPVRDICGAGGEPQRSALLLSEPPTVAALFVQRNGCYWNLPGVDPWDAARDARLYAGPHPVVAHPPCARWCRLAGFVQAISGHKIGDDGGCFAAALEHVRRWGGVLEHPAWTIAWAHHGLPNPPEQGGWMREMYGPGWVCSIDQSPYGHRAQKPTWLYYVGLQEPAPMDWRRRKGDAWLSWADSKRGVQRLGKRERNATPKAFRDALLELARGSR